MDAHNAAFFIVELFAADEACFWHTKHGHLPKGRVQCA